ncbi:MAG TPA: DUF5985 family protein [Rhizomicrobium sp.]|nr:DUF5985 family protein [Rhizomicrobium sp.]
MTSAFAAFLAGAVTMGFVVSALFFLRFWRRTQETLFLCFAIAFFLLAANQALPVLLELTDENRAGIYLLRLAAFAMIIVAILIKNWHRKR